MKSWCHLFFFFFFKKKTAYEMRISDWSSDVCSSDLGSAEMDGAFFMPRLRRRRKERGMSVAGIRSESPSAAPARSGVWRSAERRVGEECVSTCRSRWSPFHSKQHEYDCNTARTTLNIMVHTVQSRVAEMHTR